MPTEPRHNLLRRESRGVCCGHEHGRGRDYDLETSDGEHTLTLCHYPMMTFNHCMRAYMVHGHIHGNTNADYWPYLQSHDRILNASVEVNNYEPVTFAELLANNQRYKAQHPERAM